MNDQELLRLAAKAAGAEWTDYQRGTPNHWHIERADGVWREWNPLNDDGDALRLAVKLGLAVRVLEKCVFVESDPETLLGQSSVSELEMYGRPRDPYAATRRAITRAAAEIARTTDTGGEA
ncbi:hypothetical protein DM48_351 [Burkholderia gladioli]|uniref:Phage ABA sandwich domain-containing protein n=1 Tax=Burkholderia gladioli TaxID=28095 RepID=A0AAW3EVH4_BURGA|nr:hypothetical protein [Burkholderia gladioli]KGC12889.1 hypothetical protein DM48_351 [Burkholderia gladioli]